MRTLLIFSSSQIGGAERSLSRMAFASKSVEYQLATIDNEGPWCEWVRSQGHEPVVYGSSGGLFSLVKRLYQDIRGKSFDVVYVCGSRVSLLLRLLMIFTPGVKLVHGIRWNPDSNSRLDRFLRVIERLFHPLVDGWITNSVVARKTLIRRCRIPTSKVHVIYNGLDEMPVQVTPLIKRPLHVLTVANLSARKGYLEYLEVVREVSSKVPGARFIFIGRDDMAGSVQRKITQLNLDGVVEYVGFQADVTSWFERARVFALPSLWNEGCPTSLLEAMSYSIPCVAFNIDGIPELVETERQGILLDKGDYDGMAKALIRLLTDDDLAIKQGKEGWKKVDSKFKISNTVEQHDKVLRSLFSGAND